jgi:hypothetical protein
MAMTVTAAFVTLAVASTIIPPVLFTVTIPTTAMPLLIKRNVIALVPVVPHKVDPLAAGIVLVAMLAPVLSVPRGNAQIDWFALYHYYSLDDSRLRIDHAWRRIWVVANVDTAIEAWLADGYRNSNVGGECRGGNGSGSHCRCNQKAFQVDSPLVNYYLYNARDNDPMTCLLS